MVYDSMESTGITPTTGDGVQWNLERSSVEADQNGGLGRLFETVFKAMVSVLERSLSEKGGLRRTTAQSIAALSIGGMVVARTMVDRALADELRAACMAVALNLGGWNKIQKRKSKNGKFNRSRPVLLQQK